MRESALCALEGKSPWEGSQAGPQCYYQREREGEGGMDGGRESLNQSLELGSRITLRTHSATLIERPGITFYSHGG